MFDSSRLKGSCKNCDNHALLNVLSAIGAHWAANSIQLNRLGAMAVLQFAEQLNWAFRFACVVAHV